MDSDDELADVNRKIEVLWRVNFEEFLWRLIHKVRYYNYFLFLIGCQKK